MCVCMWESEAARRGELDWTYGEIGQKAGWKVGVQMQDWVNCFLHFHRSAAGPKVTRASRLEVRVTPDHAGCSDHMKKL